jgi:chaperonin GroEL (HSP60 family)
VDEAERAIVDALGAVTSAVEDGQFVVGGGAIEMELAMRLRKHAVAVGGREQLAIQAFADALEIIPRTLAESAGMDAIDALVDLRSKHEKKGSNYGVNVYAAKISDLSSKVIEPAKVKKQAIQSASEVVEMILRIDDIIAAKGHPPAQGGAPGGMPPGMDF